MCIRDRDIPGKSQFRKFIASGMSDDKTIVISTHQVRDIDKVDVYKRQILTGALAVISYNYFTNKIDKLTYGLDEVGFSIVQTFAQTDLIMMKLL